MPNYDQYESERVDYCAHGFTSLDCGTLNSYKQGCSGPECCQANASYERNRRLQSNTGFPGASSYQRKETGFGHGTDWQSYASGCECTACYLAHRRQVARWQAEDEIYGHEPGYLFLLGKPGQPTVPDTKRGLDIYKHGEVRTYRYRPLVRDSDGPAYRLMRGCRCSFCRLAWARQTVRQRSKSLPPDVRDARNSAARQRYMAARREREQAIDDYLAKQSDPQAS